MTPSLYPYLIESIVYGSIVLTIAGALIWDFVKRKKRNKIRVSEGKYYIKNEGEFTAPEAEFTLKKGHSVIYVGSAKNKKLIRK